MISTPDQLRARLRANPAYRRAVQRQVAARRRAAARQAAVPGFGRWLRGRWPAATTDWRWDWPHLQLIQDALAEVTAGRVDRLAIFVPPRHGKSELVTVRYAAYRVVRDPRCRVIVGAYNQTFAGNFTEAARGIVQAEPGTEPLAKSTATEWATSAGGGAVAAGVGSGVTGRGANLIIIDDPVKSRAEAHSEAYRNRVAGWYQTDLWSRQEPGAAIILIMTRWHQDDLAGRILGGAEGDRWRILRLPGLAETQADRDHYAESVGRPDLVGQPDPLGREPGEALFPDRYDEDFYKRAEGVYLHDFHAVVQQRPAPPEGSMLRRSWFTIEPRWPGDPVASVRYWDKAGTAGAGSHTAGVRLDLFPGNVVFVSDLVMGQWEAAEREQVIDQTADIDGRHVAVVVEQEGGSGGKESADETVRRLSVAGFACYKDSVSSEGSKIQRAEPLATLAAGGGVKLLRSDWNRRYLDILASFPHGVKDPVDATSGALRYLRAFAPIEVTENPFYN